jgi:hypothetical protein
MRLTLCALSGVILVLVAGCGSGQTQTKKKTTSKASGPPVQMVIDYMQKLIPGLDPKLDNVEGLADQWESKLLKKTKEGQTQVSLYHKGRFSANGPITDITVIFSGANLPGTQEELLRYSDGLLRAAGYSPEEAQRIAQATWNMPNPEKDGKKIIRTYLQAGDYFTVVDCRAWDVPEVRLRTVPKGTAK